MSFSLSENLRFFRRWRRGIWRKIGKKVLDKSLPPPRSELSDRLKSPSAKVLFLFNAGKIGDCICSTFVFRELKTAYPNLEIHILCSRNVATIFNHCGKFVAHVWSMKHSFRLLELAVAGIKLRRFKFSLVVARDGDIRTREILFCRLVRGEEYIGYFSSDYKIFSRNIPSCGRGIREIKGEILRHAGIENFCDEYDCPRNPEAEIEIKNFLKNQGIASGKFIALNLFGNGKNRKITTENALVLIRALQEKYAKLGWRCCLLSSPKDDSAVADVLKTWARERSEHEESESFLTAFRPTTSIFQSIELVEKSGLLISPDTSIVHVGDALKKPMIVFFVPHRIVESLGRQSWMPHKRPTTKCVHYEHDVNEIDFSNLPL